MEERFIEVKHKNYIKACEELGIKRSEFSFFVFEILWDCDFSILGENNVNLVYGTMKSKFFEDMNNSKVVDENMKLFKRKKELEEMQEEFFDEEVCIFDDEQDDYDLAVGPRQQRRR